MIFPQKKYKTLYLDPPWNETGGGKIRRGADRHYDLMKTKDIIALPIPSICEENCHLYLWVTNNFLEDGLEVMKAWGFIYKNKVEWIKGEKRQDLFFFQNFGLGQYFRGITETCLFGVKGTLPYKIIDGKRCQGKTAFVAPRREHSRKPDEMRKMIELVSYEPYCEIFAREEHPNWDCIGNEVGKFVADPEPIQDDLLSHVEDGHEVDALPYDIQSKDNNLDQMPSFSEKGNAE